MKINTQIIARIKTAQLAKGWNQSELAQQLGCHKTTVSKILKGTTKEIGDDMADAIEDALGIFLHPAKTPSGTISPAALRLSNQAAVDPRIEQLLDLLADLLANGGASSGELLEQVAIEAARAALAELSEDSSRKQG